MYTFSLTGTHDTTSQANTPRVYQIRLESGGVLRTELALLAFVVCITVRMGDINRRRVRSTAWVTSGDGGRPVLRGVSPQREDDSFAEDHTPESRQYVDACFCNSVQDPDADMTRRAGLRQGCPAKHADYMAPVFAIRGRCCG